MTISTDIDAQAYVEKGALTILDYPGLYYHLQSELKRRKNLQKEENIIEDRINEADDPNGSNIIINNSRNSIRSIQHLIKRWQSEIQKRQNNSYNQILLVGTCRAFGEIDDYGGLVAFEDALNHKVLFSPPPSLSSPSSASLSSSKSSSLNIYCICCYRHSTINKMSSLSTISHTFFSHDSTTFVDSTKKDNNSNTERRKITKRSATTYTAIRPLYPRQKIINAIMLGINKTMGSNGMSNLILKTLKVIYHIEEEDIIRQPELFEASFAKIIGKDAANLVFDVILDEMKKQIII